MVTTAKFVNTKKYIHTLWLATGTIRTMSAIQETVIMIRGICNRRWLTRSQSPDMWVKFLPRLCADSQKTPMLLSTVVIFAFFLSEFSKSIGRMDLWWPNSAHLEDWRSFFALRIAEKISTTTFVQWSSLRGTKRNETNTTEHGVTISRTVRKSCSRRFRKVLTLKRWILSTQAQVLSCAENLSSYE